MECCICTTLPVMLRPPRNTICGACYEGARTIINFINKLQDDNGITNLPTKSPSSPTSYKLLSCGQTLMNASRWVMEMKDGEEELKQKISFLSAFVTAFRDQLHPDIQIKPANNGSSISAHKAILAVRSEIFKNMLESDGCKAAPTDSTITVPDLDHEELEALLEFLYSGSLPPDKLERHVYTLSLAADKYEISYLNKLCETYMLKTLNSCNALHVLEIADICSSLALKDSALSFIVKNMEDIVFSAGYEAFALKNPHLSVQITRALLMDAKKNTISL